VLAIPVLAIGGRAPPWGDLAPLALAALCIVVGFPGFSGLAMRGLPAAHASVVIGALPLATAAVAALIDGDRPSPGFWCCAVAGSALVVAFALHKSGGALQAGDGLLLAAVASAALGYTLSAQLSRRMPARDVISWIAVLALPFSAPLSIVWRPERLAGVPASAWTCLAYLGAMSAYLGFFAWNAGLARGGVARVSQVQLAQPFLSLGLAAWLLGERVDGETALCALAVVGLVFLGRRFRVGGGRLLTRPGLTA